MRTLCATSSVFSLSISKPGLCKSSYRRNMSARGGSVCSCSAATIRADRIARAASDRDGRPPAARATRSACVGRDNCVWAKWCLLILLSRPTHSHLPLEGGGRERKRAGGGENNCAAVTCPTVPHPTPRTLRCATLPLQGRVNTIVLAMRLCTRVMQSSPRKKIHCLPERTKGGGAPIGAMSWGRVCGRGSGLKALSPLASRRSTAALTEVISLGSTPGRASWNYRVQTGGPSPAPVQRAPRGPVLVPAGRCPKPPECGVTKPARGDRSRCRLRIVSRNALHARDALNVTGMGTTIKDRVSGLRTKSFRCGITRFIEPSCPASCRASRSGGHGCAIAIRMPGQARP